MGRHVPRGFRGCHGYSEALPSMYFMDSLSSHYPDGKSPCLLSMQKAIPEIQYLLG